jgi:release factor glutamine methyltransferase
MSASTQEPGPWRPAPVDQGRPDPPLAADAVADRLRAAGCVFAEEEAQLLIEAAASPAALRVMVAERMRGVPLEHVVGWAEFCGLRIAVRPGVFVPRRRSEFLARTAATLCGPGAAVVDLACGSGAVGAAIAALAGNVELHAVDIDPMAVDCARRNLAPVGGRVYAGDLYGPLPGRLRGQVSVIAANLPYVPTEAVATMPAEARTYEPLVALDGGADGLDLLRRAAAEAPGWLRHGGHLLIEIASGQAHAAAAAFAAAGLSPSHATDTELGATMVIGKH